MQNKKGIAANAVIPFFAETAGFDPAIPGGQRLAKSRQNAEQIFAKMPKNYPPKCRKSLVGLRSIIVMN